MDYLYTVTPFTRSLLVASGVGLASIALKPSLFYDNQGRMKIWSFNAPPNTQLATTPVPLWLALGGTFIGVGLFV